MNTPPAVRRPHCSGSLRRSLSLALLTAVGATAAMSAATANRLSSSALSSTGRAALPQTVSGRVAKSTVVGSVSGDTALTMSLVLSPTAAQNAALDQLLVDQQNPASANYHKWLTPAQFGDRFGVSEDDLHVLEAWLSAQGLQVGNVPASRNSIQFTGTAANVEAAFHPGLQKLQHNGQTYIANTAVPSIPSSFSGVVGGVAGLSTYRLQPHGHTRALTTAELAQRANPDLTVTSGTTVYHYLVPYDVRQIYSANSLISSGYTGSGITIGVIGQTAVSTTQIGYFRTLTGQAVVAPTLTLVPNTGSSTAYTSDEEEAETDIEYAGGTAPGATINYIYTGNGSSDGVFTALEYAITGNLAQILTLSYGGCEQFQGTDLTTLEPYLRQASAQGQTLLNSSGDSGAVSCDSDNYATAYDGLAVSYPASSPNVTGVGGTTLNEGTGTYWSSTNNSQNGSALSYIPEVTWNDSSSSGIGASGGGASIVFSKPAWQVGTGVPADKVRHVPDVAFAAAVSHDPYLFCTADSSVTGTNSSGSTVTGACSSTSFGAYVIGGTSLSSPSFAGMLALVEQANGSGRLGNINPLLYSLFSSNSTVFQDVTSGTNQVACTAGIPGCSGGVVGYTAGTGYDQVTGLGSVNIANLSGAVTAAAAAVIKTPTLTIQQTSISTTTAGFTISVSGNSGTYPTGTLTVSVDGGSTATLTLSSGSATYTASSLASGTHTLTAVYAGDSNYSIAINTYSFTTSTTLGSFALTVNPTALSVTSGSSGTFTVSLASTGYTGLVVYSLTPASGSATLPGCFTGANGDYTYSGNTIALDTGVTSGSSVSAAIKYHAVTTGCSTLSQVVPPSMGARPGSTEHAHLPLLAFAFGGFLLGGLGLRRNARARLLSTGLLAMAFTVAMLGAAGCGNGTSPLTGTTTTTTTGSSTTYNYVVTATSYPSGSVSTTANLAITVQ